LGGNVFGKDAAYNYVEDKFLLGISGNNWWM